MSGEAVGTKMAFVAEKCPRCAKQTGLLAYNAIGMARIGTSGIIECCHCHHRWLVGPEIADSFRQAFDADTSWWMFIRAFFSLVKHSIILAWSWFWGEHGSDDDSHHA